MAEINELEDVIGALADYGGPDSSSPVRATGGRQDLDGEAITVMVAEREKRVAWGMPTENVGVDGDYMDAYSRHKLEQRRSRQLEEAGRPSPQWQREEQVAEVVVVDDMDSYEGSLGVSKCSEGTDGDALALAEEALAAAEASEVHQHEEEERQAEARRRQAEDDAWDERERKPRRPPVVPPGSPEPTTTHETAAAERRRQLAAKREFGEKTRQIYGRVATGEAELRSFLQNGTKRVGLEQAGKELLEEHCQLSRATKREERKVAASRNKIHEEVLSLRELIQGGARGTTGYLEVLQSQMEGIEASLFEFRNQMRLRFEETLSEERSLTKDIEAFEKKMKSWEEAPAHAPVKATAAAGKPKPLKSKAPEITGMVATEKRPAAVVRYEEYLEAHGGLTGGWHPKDHSHFLKLLHHYEGFDDLLIDACLAQIPGLTPESIKGHLEWHERLTLLTQDRKAAIDEWKAKKKVRQEQTLLEMETAEQVRSKPTQAAVAKTKADAAYRSKQSEDLRKYKATKAQKELDAAKLARKQAAKAKEAADAEARRRDEIKENLKRYQLEKEATAPGEGAGGGGEQATTSLQGSIGTAPVAG